MPRYTLLTGDYYILYPDLPNSGPQPDGDTISFLPDNDDIVLGLPRFSGMWPDRKHLGTYSVRFEGIDALETHYLNRHQNLEFAEAARDELLARVGFTGVQFIQDRPNNVASADVHPMRGHIMANGIESNGRILGLVYPGPYPGPEMDGEHVFVDEPMLDASVNARILALGLAYAELYSTMPLDLIAHMRGIITKARSDGEGFWSKEAVTTTATVLLNDLSSLPELVMFPKLYRRLVKYFEDGNVGLGNFDTWVRADPVGRDDRALLPTGEVGNLHDLFEVDPAGGIRLRFPPEELMFDPDPA
jgi:hypothetical protein